MNLNLVDKIYQQCMYDIDDDDDDPFAYATCWITLN